MDHGHFDALTRSVASGAGPRRTVLGLMAGGALGGLAARLGLAEGAEAKKGRKRRAQRKAHGALQSEGKRKKKHHKKPKPKPCGAACTDNGGKCCADGSCVSQALCCPGERMCAGGRCQVKTRCCNDEKPCADGSCVAANECCPNGLFLCLEACEEKVCENGEWECRGACQHPDAICCNDQCLAPCSGGKSLNPDTCRCECDSASTCLPPRERDPETCACECPNDGNFCPTGYIHLDYCCPASHPICWWAGGTRIGCLSEDGSHTCPPGWIVMPESDPEHRHCVQPSAAQSRQGEDASAEGLHSADSAPGSRDGAPAASHGRASGRGRAARKRRRGDRPVPGA